MLTLTRRAGETIFIGEGENEIKVVAFGCTNQGQMKLGFDAPKDINIRRGELAARPEGNRTAPGKTPKAERPFINVLVQRNGSIEQNYLVKGTDDAEAKFTDIWEKNDRDWESISMMDIGDALEVGFVRFSDNRGDKISISINWPVYK